MPRAARSPVRSRLALLGLMRIAFGAVLGLSWMAIVGCSSPSRGPEGDIVEVERIEVLPTETAAPADASPAGGAGPAAEEVPATPAAN